MIAASSGWRIGVGALTSEPDKQIITVDGPGQTPDPKWLLDYPVVQVLVRGDEAGYQEAVGKTRNCFDVLQGIDAQTVNGDRWDGIMAFGNPSYIGSDENQRPMFSANFRIIIEPAASALTHREPL